MEKILTIFTPTYNRAYCLSKCYESLLRQTCKEFIWLIIDDGSTDTTCELVKNWIGRKNDFEILYLYKENHGVHTAYNTAYAMSTTELTMCIDSDDYLTNSAVEVILSFWKRNKSKNHAGIIALNIDNKGMVIGSKLPDQKDIHLKEFYQNGGKGDKKLIYRTEIMRSYPPYPVIEGEKFMALSYKFLLVDEDYKLLILNRPICVVEYLKDGCTKNRYKLYMKNPKGFILTKRSQLKQEHRLTFKFRLYIQYIAFNLIAKNKHYIRSCPDSFLAVCAVPFGIAWYLYIRYRNK